MGKANFLNRETVAYVDVVVDRLHRILGDDLVGVYLHGSGALGDFTPSQSDVDVLAVCSRALSSEDKRRIAESLSEEALPCPAVGLEFSLVTREAALNPTQAPAFELHVTTMPEDKKVVDGAGHLDDSDLVMHFAVLREHGRALMGPEPSRIFPPIPSAQLLEAFVGELRWAEEHGSPSYQVLNACRAWRFFEEGVLCSKLEGAAWAKERATVPSVIAVIEAAVAHRRGFTDAHPRSEIAREFLQKVARRVEEGRPDWAMR